MTVKNAVSYKAWETTSKEKERSLFFSEGTVSPVTTL